MQDSTTLTLILIIIDWYTLFSATWTHERRRYYETLINASTQRRHESTCSRYRTWCAPSCINNDSDTHRTMRQKWDRPTHKCTPGPPTSGPSAAARPSAEFAHSEAAMPPRAGRPHASSSTRGLVTASECGRDVVQQAAVRAAPAHRAATQSLRPQWWVRARRGSSGEQCATTSSGRSEA